MVYGILFFDTKTKIVCFDRYYNSSANDEFKNERSFNTLNIIIR